MFRFHTGSIKRKAQDSSNYNHLIRFDSILVRLKDNIRFYKFSACGGFDSILVRLKEVEITDELATEIGFDSILVRLKVHSCLRVFFAFRLARFDSILVRLKVD